IVPGFVAGQTQSRAADREALVVQERADLPDHQDILTLVITPVTAALDRIELGELLLPVAQHVRLYRAQFADLTNGEVALARYGRQFVVMTWFQHMPQLSP